MGNRLADSLAKEAAKEMIDSQEEFYEGEADKKETIRLMKGSIVDKWQIMYENFEHTEKLLEIIPNMEKVTKYRGEERKLDNQVCKSDYNRSHELKISDINDRLFQNRSM